MFDPMPSGGSFGGETCALCERLIIDEPPVRVGDKFFHKNCGKAYKPIEVLNRPYG